MRIIQILPVIAFGDAIGNHVLALSDAFTRRGYKNKIYAEMVDSRIPKGKAEHIDYYKEQKGDVILYHMSTGSPLNRRVLEYQAPKIMNYHNITPAHFFHGYLSAAEKGCIEAREDLAYMAGKMDACVSDSKYNQQELEELGYHCPMTDIPILIAFDDYKKQPDEETLRQYREDGYTNIVFVGRVVPNKKQEDLIEAFYYYKKYYNPQSRLILVGSFAGVDVYGESLKAYADILGIKEDVIFTGQISFPKILAYYRAADVFLCMSEHEGFCVPVVEAMYFGDPIIAYDSTAVGDTMGGGGILLKEKKPLETAGMIHYLMNHAELKEQILANQKERLEAFSHERVEKAYMDFLQPFLQE